ncbi:hypothetical protein [Peteryoungia ipomoeae]|uniref:Uncharacterized protein n=1 Tax=Peteryoungia ipomoeae TaxID=1210932 RepID=A0A4S8P164_9HYPH|nr:hypothetical protein [Peteryoungia ipomoeae]THV21334.1 hypothetical protein FAA97_15025 [Peteryoungia ipomoeae]
MTHHATPQFWAGYNALPKAVQRLADRNFERLKVDPDHPSLHFKQIGKIWSARVGIGYRALAIRSGDDWIWFWIGSHADYDKLLER